jgi:chitodextrinase
LDVPGGAKAGVGNPTPDPASVVQFAAGAWPNIADHAQWGTGTGGSGAWWKALFSWGGTPQQFPSLYFETR